VISANKRVLQIGPCSRSRSNTFTLRLFATDALIAGSRGPFSSTASNIPSAPRGPPRKPKQSGHALWVGNLPPGALISDLKDHFSQDAKIDIESVFLISKSNCAFVNYRNEDACIAAMKRFHDSRFQGVRLVCRLRKTPGLPVGALPGSSPASTIPSGPAALQKESRQGQTAEEAIAENRQVSSKASDGPPTNFPVNDKYFIVKSLTLEDLELSVRNNIWATQGHNEESLNKAYRVRPTTQLLCWHARVNHLHRLSKTSFSSSPPTNLVNILGTHAWTPQSMTKQQKTWNGSHVPKQRRLTQIYRVPSLH